MQKAENANFLQKKWKCKIYEYFHETVDATPALPNSCDVVWPPAVEYIFDYFSLSMSLKSLLFSLISMTFSRAVGMRRNRFGTIPNLWALGTCTASMAWKRKRNKFYFQMILFIPLVLFAYTRRRWNWSEKNTFTQEIVWRSAVAETSVDGFYYLLNGFKCIASLHSPNSNAFTVHAHIQPSSTVAYNKMWRCEYECEAEMEWEEMSMKICSLFFCSVCLCQIEIQFTFL